MAAEADNTASVPDSGVSDLTSDYFPADTSTQTEPTSTPDQAAQTTADASQAAPEQSAQAPTASEQPQSFDFQGKKYTAADLQAIFTTAQQLPHLQQKYLQLLEAQKQQAQQPPQPAQPPAQQGQGLTPAQVQAAYVPVVQDAVKGGWVEEELAIAFPNFTANALMYRDAVNDTRQAVTTLIDRLNAIENGSVQKDARGEIDSNIASLAGQGFPELADPNTRANFFQYLVDLNPQVGHLRNPEFIARQWVAYNKDSYLANATAAQQAQAAEANRRARTRSNAQGEGNSTRPGGTAPPSGEFWDDLLSDRFAPPR